MKDTQNAPQIQSSLSLTTRGRGKPVLNSGMQQINKLLRASQVLQDPREAGEVVFQEEE
jgi:hypothetical protein